MTELISRRKMLSLLGLAAAGATAPPSALLMVSSDAEAQTTRRATEPSAPEPGTTRETGTERRTERRTRRVKRRVERRRRRVKRRVSRRAARKKGRAERRELRRGD